VNRFYTRRFLNHPGHHAGAYILAVVEETDAADLDAWCDVTLELTDCSRRVSFDFPLDSEDDRRNSVHKARVLARELTRFAEELAVEADVAARREAARRARRQSSAA
jgi:hypothetical protein